MTLPCSGWQYAVQPSKQTHCACEALSKKRKSNYKQGRIYLICWPNASKTGNHNDHRLL